MRAIPCCQAVLLLILLVATPLLAQERCEPNDTATRCLERVYLKHVNAQEWSDLQNQPTGVDTGGANVATTKKDFNPLMALTGLLGTGTDGADGAEGTMLLNLNLPFFIHNPAKAKNVQIQALANTQPQLSELISNAIQNDNAIPADDRDDRISQLEEKIGDVADYTIRFTYNYTNASHGRSFEQYKDGFESLCSGALKSDAWKTAKDEAFKKLGVAADEPINSMAPERVTRMLQQAEELWDLQDQILDAAGIEKYDQLVDNQPQFHLTLKRTFRDPLAGSDELSAKVTYEWGNENLNKVAAGCGDGGDWKDPSCYTKYVTDKALAIDRGHRISFSGEYVEAEGETILTGFSDIDPLASEDFRKLVLSLVWGRKLNLGGEPVQLDLGGSYEDVSDDPARQDRGIVRLTLTRNVGGMSIPFGIVYANHSEFLADEDIDARLSAHIGLKFNMSGMKSGQ